MFYYVQSKSVFLTIDLSKTEVLLNVGSKKFCDLNLKVEGHWVMKVSRLKVIKWWRSQGNAESKLLAKHKGINCTKSQGCKDEIIWQEG